MRMLMTLTLDSQVYPMGGIPYNDIAISKYVYGNNPLYPTRINELIGKTLNAELVGYACGWVDTEYSIEMPCSASSVTNEGTGSLVLDPGGYVITVAAAGTIFNIIARDEEDDILAIYPVCSGAGTTLYDISGNDNHSTLYFAGKEANAMQPQYFWTGAQAEVNPFRLGARKGNYGHIIPPLAAGGLAADGDALNYPFGKFVGKYGQWIDFNPGDLVGKEKLYLWDKRAVVGNVEGLPEIWMSELQMLPTYDIDHPYWWNVEEMNVGLLSSLINDGFSGGLTYVAENDYQNTLYIALADTEEPV